MSCAAARYQVLQTPNAAQGGCISTSRTRPILTLGTCAWLKISGPHLWSRFPPWFALRQPRRARGNFASVSTCSQRRLGRLPHAPHHVPVLWAVQAPEGQDCSGPHPQNQGLVGCFLHTATPATPHPPRLAKVMRAGRPRLGGAGWTHARSPASTHSCCPAATILQKLRSCMASTAPGNYHGSGGRVAHEHGAAG